MNRKAENLPCHFCNEAMGPPSNPVSPQPPRLEQQTHWAQQHLSRAGPTHVPSNPTHVYPVPVPLQVKVMLRICSTLARDTSESSSFLKVDPRKKQVTLYDPLACGGQSAFQKRGSQVPPKMFAFDAVFPQDASQVGADPPLPLSPLPPGQAVLSQSWSCCSFAGTQALEVTPRARQGGLHCTVPLSNWSSMVGRTTEPGFPRVRPLGEGGAHQPGCHPEVGGSGENWKLQDQDLEVKAAAY